VEIEDSLTHVLMHNSDPPNQTFSTPIAQGCGLGQDVSVSTRSRDVLTSRLGLGAIRLGFGPVGLVSNIGLLRLVETLCAGTRRP